MTPSSRAGRLGGAEVLQVSVPVATLWTSPEAPRAIDAPALLGAPDVTGWTARMDASVRKGLTGRTLTQLLMGEDVVVLEERGDWVRVGALGQPSSAHEQGYPGWMRRDHLSAPIPSTAGPKAVVMTPTAACEVDGGPVSELSFGTALRVRSVEGGAARVVLPRGRSARVPLEHLRLVDEGQQPDFGAGDVLAVAAQFVGLGYLWGGTSAWGLDCSGLVHLVHRAFGLVLPRDACDQAAHVRPVPVDDVLPGDLYFFARPGEPVSHVGIASRSTGDDRATWMLHAPETGEHVVEEPLGTDRLDTLVVAGRVVAATAGAGTPTADRDAGQTLTTRADRRR